MPINIPNNPNEGRRDPFEGPGGENPFSEGRPDAEQAQPVSKQDSERDSSAYAAPAPHTGPSYRPQHVTTQQHRGGLVLALGAIGMVGSLVGPISILLVGVGSFCIMTVPWVCLTATLPACFMGFADLAAIRTGAMDDSGRTATRAGYVMGVIGLVSTFTSTAYLVVAIIALTAQSY